MSGVRARLAVGLGLICLVVLPLDAPGGLRAVVILPAVLLLPGAAVLSFVAIRDKALWAGLAVCVSLAVEAVVLCVLLWLRIWHPDAVAAVLVVLSVAIIVVNARRSRSAPASGEARQPVAGALTDAVPTDAAPTAYIPRGGVGAPTAPLARGDAGVHTAPIARRTGGVEAEGRAGSPRPRVAAVGLLVAPGVLAAVLFAVSVGRVDPGRMGQYGMLTVLPATWYLALALLLAGAVAVLTRPVVNRAAAAGYLFGIVFVLFGTAPLVYSVPHYSWVYNYVGVTRYILAHHSLDGNVDIYQRWPGFFAVAAFLSGLTRTTDPLVFAQWAEVFFVSVSALLVSCLGRSYLRSVSLGWVAALVFVAGNWVGQSYFAPQGLALTLALAIYCLLVEFCRPPGRGATAVADATTLRRWAIVVAVLLQAAVVVSHQLTPYLIVVSVVVLVASGLVRPWLLVVLMAALAVAFLIPNLHYITSHFGVASSPDPLQNLRRVDPYGATPLPGKALHARAGTALSMLVWLLAAAAVVRGRLRRRPGAGVLGLLFVSPAILVLGQDYGGEAIFRVYLFSLPWAAVAIASGMVRSEPRPVPARPAARRARRADSAVSVMPVTPVQPVLPVVRARRVGVVALACTGAFLPAFFGQEELNYMPAGTVAASDYFYGHALSGSVLMCAAPNFPRSYGPNYDEFIHMKNGDEPNMLLNPDLRGRDLGPADVSTVVSEIRKYSSRGYLAFADSGDAYVRTFQLAPAGALGRLEAAVARSPSFRLWYHNADTRIYALADAGAVGAVGVPDAVGSDAVGVAKYVRLTPAPSRATDAVVTSGPAAATASLGRP
ncbi:hypothetical protein [Frankia sp. AvcI1]|uniref:hypothetical protein n=1 Tax=Frankia sp. AvcI1 TaxID=573496 RepID=UPI002118D154|nr:hypothetical protein [Frankia sp. AvcI1]